MTQTTPSHSQSVEAAAKAALEHWQEWGDKRGFSLRMDALDTALTSQQEVVAPVGDAPTDEQIMRYVGGPLTSVSDNRPLGQQWDQVCHLVRIVLAASRVPVASLASREQVNLAACGGGGALQRAVADAWENYERMGSVCEFESQPMIYASTLEEIHDAAAHREQGVEVVRAEPVAEVRRGHYGGRTRNIGFQHVVLLPGADLMDGTKLYAAPPSSKTQDDLAGAGVEGDFLIPRRLAYRTWAFLAQDCSPCAAAECQIDGKNVGVDGLVAEWAAVTRVSLASQPKAPAPGPVASLAVPADVLKAATSFKNDGYRGPLAWARKVFDWVVEQGATPATEQATTGSGQDSGSVHLGSGAGGEVQGPFRIAALADISAERTRQMRVKGWTPEHDSQHNNGELAEAASVYAMPNWKRRMSEGNPPTDQVWPIGWPWNLEDFKPKDDRRNLVKAGALIVAEIERLDRAAILSTASPAGEVKP